MARLRPIAWAWVPVVVWMALILTLSGRSDFPSRQNPATGEPIRTTLTMAKTAHVVEYTILGWLLFRATSAHRGGFGLAPTRAAIWSIVAATAFGAGDELRQSLVPSREPRLADIAIDGVSALASVTVLLALRRRRDAREATSGIGN